MFIFENITTSPVGVLGFFFVYEIFHWKMSELIWTYELLWLSHKYSQWRKLNGKILHLGPNSLPEEIK